MDEKERQIAIREFMKKHPALDQLIAKLLSSNEADFLFQKMFDNRNHRDEAKDDE